MIRSLTFFVLSVSAATVAAGQQAGPRRCRDCATTVEGRASAEARAAQVRDSIRAQAMGFDGDIERVAAQLLMSKQLQIQVQQTLQSLQSGQIAEGSRAAAELSMRRLRQQLEQASRETSMLRTQLASLCDRSAKPQGYMGITFSATMRAEAGTTGTEVFRFAENPTVETVEPDSPAERAGVEKGDEIILIGGQNVVGRDIVFTRLLRPGNRLPIRVRRDGDTRDVLLIVSQRPPSLDNGCPFLDARIMAAFGDQLRISQMPVSGSIVRAPRPAVASAPASGGTVRVVPAPDAPVAVGSSRGGIIAIAPPGALVPRVPLPAPAVGDPGSEPSVFVITGSSTAPMAVAGATIIRTNPDLRETFGVKSGVLVLDVARGTPAYKSGLKGGDVIVGIGRASVTSPLSVQRAIETADGREITLRVVRKKQPQSIVLRW